MDPNSKANIAYQGNPPAEPNGKTHIVPSGGVLGGGSSINLMMYTRGQQSDYDSWDTPGWTAEELVPYFKKVRTLWLGGLSVHSNDKMQLETYHGPDPTSRHGTNGPIHISGGTFRSSRAEDAFVTAAAQVGWPEFDDLQILDANNGIQRAMRFVSPDGKRQSTAAQYLHPLLQDNNHPNLHVLVETQVVRVLITDGNATGVEYTRNASFHPDTPHPARTVTAKRQIVLSCGALGTPLVLERSGVGNPSILTRASVPVTVPLPGVGSAYQDHNLLVYPYLSSLTESETLDALATNRPGHTPADLLTANSPLLGWTGQDVTCKLRPSAADIPSLSPALRASWAADFASHPDRPLMLMSLVGVFGGDLSTLLPTPSPQQYFSISTFTAYPYSRGHIHIKSASPQEGAHSPVVDFDPGFFTDDRDVAMRTPSPHRFLNPPLSSSCPGSRTAPETATCPQTAPNTIFQPPPRFLPPFLPFLPGNN
jgi:choline dehydrogenase-like flavoprotein